MPVRTYQQALDWLYSFVRFDESRKHIPGGGDLARMRHLLDLLGAPQTRYPSVLIAGTKGKGSTAAMLASMLRAAGYRTGFYSSPHLHTFRERIRVDERLITRDEIVAGTLKLEALVDRVPGVIWFELVTALAFDHFAREGVEIAVLEVGLGGRLDATNVVTPLVSVVTPISYDHMDVLGHTLTAIASEKAGIIKPGVAVVSAPQEPEAASVIQATAAERQAPLIEVGHDVAWEPVDSSLKGQTFRVGGLEYDLPLPGPHQLANASTALAAAFELRRLGWQVQDAAMQEGLRKVEWPVRFEVLQREPTIIADGAHNRAAAHALRQTVEQWLPGQRIHLVFGASNDKDIEGMFEELLPLAGSLILTHSRHVRAADPGWLADLAAPHGIVPTQTKNIREALRTARERAAAGDVILVTGSLFVAAEARALIRAEQGRPVDTDDS